MALPDFTRFRQLLESVGAAPWQQHRPTYRPNPKGHRLKGPNSFFEEEPPEQVAVDEQGRWLGPCDSHQPTKAGCVPKTVAEQGPERAKQHLQRHH